MKQLLFLLYLCMKLYRQRDLKKCGIYCITNITTGKKYVGKSINIYERIRAHINLLNKSSKNENEYFKNAWKKYGRDDFYYEVLEYLELDEELIRDRELYWIDTLETTNRNKGYNLRRDSSTKMIVSESTRKKLSEAGKKRYLKNPDERKKISLLAKEMWKCNIRKQGMIEKLKIVNSKYKFHQYDKDGNFIKTYNSINDVIVQNPSFRKQNIYQVCYGYKKTHLGYKWKKELKI